MIEPDKKTKNKEDKSIQAVDIILEILNVGDSKTEGFKRKINQIYERLKSLDRKGFFGMDSFPRSYSNEKAISIFELGLKFLTEHLELLKYYSAFLFQTRHFREAIPCLKKIVELEPESCHGWNFLGFGICNIKSEFDEEPLGDPEKCFKKALELDESYQEAWLNLGIFYKRKNRFKDAIHCLEKALELNAEDDFALFALGHVHQITGNGDLAIKLYNKSLALNPCSDSVWNNLGFEHAKRFEFTEAIQMYVRALQFNAESEVTWYNLKYAYLGTEQFKKADYCQDKAENLRKIDLQWKDQKINNKREKEKEIWYYT